MQYTYLVYHLYILCIYTTMYIFCRPPAMSKTRLPTTMVQSVLLRVKCETVLCPHSTVDTTSFKLQRTQLTLCPKQCRRDRWRCLQNQIIFLRKLWSLKKSDKQINDFQDDLTDTSAKNKWAARHVGVNDCCVNCQQYWSGDRTDQWFCAKAYTSARSLWKLYISIIKKYYLQDHVSHKHVTKLWNTGPHRLASWLV